MGIRGLTGFIDKNQELLHQHELHDTSVVIDGNNFYYYLYYGCNVNSTFGGDYDIFRSKVASAFQGMRDCGITPYVVLDGAYNVDSRKLKTSLTRAASRIQLVDTIGKGYKGQVLPVLAYETFRQVMVEMAIPHVMCQFEADSDAATLANRLNCPVISNDSDFYIFDLKSGFLPLDYVNFQPVRRLHNDCETGSKSYLHCYKYHVDDFIDSFDGLDRSTLPIFATMLGNDYIEASAFSSFYTRFKVPKLVSRRFHLPPKMTKVISVLHWLNTQADKSGLSHMKEQLLKYVPPQTLKIVERMFDTAVMGYVEVGSFEGWDLHKYFSPDATSQDGNLNVSDEFACYNGSSFPTWFLDCACKGLLTPHILNAAILHRVIILTQVEALHLDSAFVISSQLRSVLYSILAKDDSLSIEVKNQVLKSCCETNQDATVGTNDMKLEASDKTDSEGFSLAKDKEVSDMLVGPENEEEVETSGDESVHDESSSDEDGEIAEFVKVADRSRSAVVSEYTRTGKQLKKNDIELVDRFDTSKLPGLEELSTLPVEKREAVLLTAFRIEGKFVKLFPPKLKMFALCLIFWLRNCEPKVTTAQFEALTLCLLYLSAARELKSKKKKKQNPCKVLESSERQPQVDQTAATVFQEKESETLDIDDLCSKCERDQLKFFTAKLDKHHKTAPVFNRGKNLNTVTVHALAQLQALVADACNLNRVLQRPLPNPRPAELINGTLFYNLATDISGRPRPDLYISLMFGDDENATSNSMLYIFYQRLRSFILQELDLEKFLTQPTHGKSKRKKNKKKEEKKAAKKHVDVDVAEENADKDNGLDSVYVTSYKFSLLMMCD